MGGKERRARLQELEVDLHIFADGVLNGLLHGKSHVLEVLVGAVDRNIDVNGPLGDAVAQRFLGALGKGLGELGVVPGVVAVVQVDAFEYSGSISETYFSTREP